jgi:branched-chain amino acid transport system permease protein
MDSAAVSILSGLAYGMVLFLIATGLSLVLGLMGVVNLAHGVIFMTGAYAGIVVTQHSNFLVGAVAGIITSLVLGVLIERGFLRFLYRRELDQILVTFGFIYIVTNVTLWIYGPYPKSGIMPEVLSHPVTIGGYNLAIYRLVVIGLGAVLCVALYWMQERTRVGAVIRAGMDDPETVNSLGTNLMRYNIFTFALGAVLAGFAGFIGAPVLGGVQTVTGESIIFTAISVCIVGGVGSVQGALVGALLIGVVTSLTQSYVPSAAIYIPYLLMVVILIFRPRGLVGRRI